MNAQSRTADRNTRRLDGPAMVVLAGLIMLLAVLSAMRNAVWRDDIGLWQDAVGKIFEANGQLEQAARRYREGGFFPQALAIWRKRNRPRDAQRVLKLQAKSKPRRKKPKIQEEAAPQGELF